MNITRWYESVAAILLALALVPLTFAQSADGPYAERFLGMDLDAHRSAAAPVLPNGFYLENAAPGASFVIPTAISFAPDGRIFVAEKRGMVWVIENGQKLQTPFIDLRNEVMSHHDRGLLGMTLHPEFDDNGYVYLLYVVDHDGTGSYDRTDAFSRLTRYTAAANDPNVADMMSRHIVLGETFSEGIPACYNSHAIGTVIFGGDGMLLVGSGDAASYNYADAGGTYPDCFGEDRIDPYEDIGAFRSQYLGSLAGKILRIHPETGEGRPGNPFYTGDPTENQSRVWMLGLRNPFRFSVGPDGISDPQSAWPGTLYVGDVGWFSWEDLNVGYGGENFGWPCYEGPEQNSQYQAQSPAHSGCENLDPAVHAAPTYYWNHGIPDHSNPPGLQGATIVAGDMYRGTRYPEELHDRIFYADYSRGWMAHTGTSGPGGLSSNHTVFSTNTGPMVDLRYDAFSELMHFVNIGAGAVMRLRHVNDGWSDAPIAHASATPTQGPAPLHVQFTGSDSFDPAGGALTFSWDFGDGGSSTQANPAHVYTAEGTYTATLTVENQLGLTASAEVPIVVADIAPEAIILSPAPVSFAASGDVVTLQAATVPGGATYEWSVTLIHNDHQHHDILNATGPEVDFTVPEHGLLHELVYFKIDLTVTDGGGLSSSTSRHFMLGTSRHHDVTVAGEPIALITNPTGVGNHNIEVIRDGNFPDLGSTDPMLQYDTDTFTSGRDEDWIGYAYDRDWTFTHLIFQEGLVRQEGGFFEDVTVQIRQGGVWVEPNYAAIVDSYSGADGESFTQYAIVFAPMAGDGIRVFGTPGGARTFISAAELRAFALLPEGDLPDPWTALDIGYLPDPGWSGHDDGLFSIAAGGDAWGNDDRLRFIHQSLDGDGSITARLHSVTGENSWAKAGLMVRGTLETGSPHASFWVTPGQGRHLQVRAEPNGSTASPVGSSAGAPAWLRLERSGTSVTAFQSGDGIDWAEFASAEIEISGPVFVGMAIAATDYVGSGDQAVATFSDVVVEADDSEPPPPGQLPDQWTSTDIGFVHVPGSATYTDGTFEVVGAGDIWGNADGFHYAYTTLRGDGSVAVRVDALDADHDWAKAGLMLRATTEPSSPHVSLYSTPGNGVNLQFREEDGGSTASPFARPGNAPVWLRLEREGEIVTAYTSSMGSTWTLLGSVEVDFPEIVLIGLAATATDYEGRQDTATLTASELTIVHGAPPPGEGGLPEPWLNADVGPVPIAGLATYSDGVFTVEGSGDAWGNDDRLHMMYQPLAGGVVLSAEVLSVDGVHPWAKGGLTVRGSLESNAPHASLWATPGRGLSFQYRARAGGSTDVGGSLTQDAPTWLRIARDGNLVAAYSSEDGHDWHHIGTVEVDLGEEVFIGLGITPTDYEGQLQTATLQAQAVSIDPQLDALPPASIEDGGPPFGIDSIYPNPMSNVGTVVLVADSPGMYRVEMFDLLGRRVWQLETREDGAGQIELALAAQSLPSGTYVLRALSPSNESVIRRLTVVR